jgi:hypothetical protein
MCKNAPPNGPPEVFFLVKISIQPSGLERMNDWGENDINVVINTHSKTLVSHEKLDRNNSFKKRRQYLYIIL